MLKGCQKKIYYMKNPPGRYFEEAYLILKRDLPDGGKCTDQPDLVCEANRIIRDAADYFAPPKTPLFTRGAAFALGAASSSALIGAVALIIGLA